MFCLLIKNSLLFWGLRCGFALRRYVSGLAGLLGPAALAAPWSGPSGHPSTSLGRLAFGHRAIYLCYWGLVE